MPSGMHEFSRRDLMNELSMRRATHRLLLIPRPDSMVLAIQILAVVTRGALDFQPCVGHSVQRPPPPIVNQYLDQGLDKPFINAWT
jgi:hypothetical protein